MSALANQWTQFFSDERHFIEYGEMFSGVDILGLVVALVLAQENRPQYLILVRLADQPLDLSSSVFIISRGTW